MLAAIRLINQNPVKRELWVVAWTYKQEFKVDKIPLRFAAVSKCTERVRCASEGSAQLQIIHLGFT
jgi:hypothetical protein